MIKKDWAYRYLGMYSSSGKANVKLIWVDQTMKMEAGETLKLGFQ